MLKATIIYHSGYGHTEVIAKAILRGLSAKNIEGSLIKISKEGAVSEQDWKALDDSHAIIFGSPTYMGCVSGPFKTFADATSRTWMQQKWKDKIAAGFTNSGGLSGDKLSSLTAIALLAAQHGMVWVGNAIMPDGNSPQSINRLTSFLGMMAQSDNASPEITPPEGDIKTAEIFGARVADATIRWFN